MSSDTVLVAGAGPTGLALACDLRGSGIQVRVVDRAAGPASTSRALGLQPRGTEVLDRAGALGDLEQRSLPIGRVAVHLGDGATAFLRLGQRTRLVTRPGLLVSQADVEASLRARLVELGGRVEWGVEVVDARQDDAGVDARLSDGSTARYGWLVGCDGAHSRVRGLAGVGFPGVQIVERFLLADVHADLPAGRDTASVWLRGEEMLAAFPLPGEDLWRLMSPAAGGDTAGGDTAGVDRSPQSVLAELTARLQEVGGLPAGAVRSAEWVSTFRIHRRLADRFRQGRMLLAGDAAHIHSPVGGQGLNTGLGDAENLAWKLALVASHRADPALLDTYGQERRPVAAEVLQSTSAMTRMLVGENLAARLARDRVLVPLLNRRPVQKLIWERASQLQVTYRGGPLAPRRLRLPGRGLSAGPLPGDRLPDIACVHADGRVTRLHRELGSRWALIVPQQSQPQLADAARACTELVRERLGPELVTVLTAGHPAHEHVLLVRPDGHLGWRGAASPAGVGEWLDGVTRRGAARL